MILCCRVHAPHRDGKSWPNPLEDSRPPYIVIIIIGVHDILRVINFDF